MPTGDFTVPSPARVSVCRIIICVTELVSFSRGIFSIRFGAKMSRSQSKPELHTESFVRRLHLLRVNLFSTHHTGAVLTEQSVVAHIFAFKSKDIV